MTPSSPSEPPEKKSNMPPCKHPRVQIVSREEDSEFVECKECGEIFESSEFKDMIIEDTKLPKNPRFPSAVFASLRFRVRGQDALATAGGAPALPEPRVTKVTLLLAFAVVADITIC